MVVYFIHIVNRILCFPKVHNRSSNSLSLSNKPPSCMTVILKKQIKSVFTLGSETVGKN